MKKTQLLRDVRSALIAAITLAPFAPVLADKLNWDTTAGVGATFIVAAGLVNRVSQVPAVKTYLKTKLNVNY